MNTPEFLNLLQHVPPASAASAIIEKKYHTALSTYLQTILALCNESVFWDGNKFCRLLSLSEIAQAPENLHVDFVRYKAIPFFDCGENDFIVYLISENMWSMFNIVDEVFWKKKQTLEALLPL